MQYSVKTDVGCVRAVNEDNFLARPDLGVWMVSDGMGGLDRGELASQLTCQTICARITQGDDVPFAIEYTHDLIKQHARLQPNCRGMGATLVMLHVKPTGNYIYWVGDSRAYQITHTGITQLTKDHSRVQELIDANLLSIADAKTHPHRHLITQSVGVEMNKALKVAHVCVNNIDNTQILLCSDGLSNELDDYEILSILQRSDSLERSCAALIEAAKQKGGRDNITAMLICCECKTN